GLAGAGRRRLDARRLGGARRAPPRRGRRHPGADRQDRGGRSRAARRAGGLRDPRRRASIRGERRDAPAGQRRRDDAAPAKTPRALGLLRRGLQLLSDELALSLPDGRTIAPYPRTPQLRPGTPELVAGLGFLLDREPDDVGAGRKWPLLPDELERTFPGCLGE